MEKGNIGGVATSWTSAEAIVAAHSWCLESSHPDQGSSGEQEVSQYK